MKITDLRPMLWTKQLKESIEFYESKLQFKCTSYDEEWGWATLKKDDVHIMLAFPNEHMKFKQSNFTGSFYFYNKDVESIWRKLKNEVEVCYPLEEFDYGMKEFGIYDNNGYLLQFGQEIEIPELEDLDFGI